MSTAALDGVVGYLRRLGERSLCALADGQLLDRFNRDQDEGAYAELVRRHGPMVLAVCRRVLHDGHDAEDAFQAVFFILARKAKARGWRDSVADWLYLVAYRLAVRLRRDRQRLRRELPPRQPPSVDPLEAVSGRELCAAVDEELSRLPERLRAGIVLCCLQGVTRDEAARALGWSLGTLKRRLEQGRALLRARLEKRGFELPAALAGVLVAEGVSRALVPTALAHSVACAAAGTAAVSPRVLALAQAFGHGPLFSPLRMAAAVVIAVSLVGGVGLAVGYRQSVVSPAQPVKVGDS